MFGRKKQAPRKKYDETRQIPVLRCSICNGEQVAGFKDIQTGRFEEVGLIRSEAELKQFMKEYGVTSLKKEY